jgi:DNA-binding NarL/FixJ family response regulator
MDLHSLGRILARPAPVAAPGASERPAPLHAFTPREKEILEGIAFGLKNREIAALMGVTVETVKSHVNHLFSKMKVTDRAQAVVWATRHGIEGKPPVRSPREHAGQPGQAS